MIFIRSWHIGFDRLIFFEDSFSLLPRGSDHAHYGTEFKREGIIKITVKLLIIRQIAKTEKRISPDNAALTKFLTNYQRYWSYRLNFHENISLTRFHFLLFISVYFLLSNEFKFSKLSVKVVDYRWQRVNRVSNRIRIANVRSISYL